jgi:hypothetical protein
MGKFIKSIKPYKCNTINNSRNPTPNRLFDAWKPFTDRSKYIKILGTKIDDLFRANMLKDVQFEKNHEKIESLLRIGAPFEDPRYSAFSQNSSKPQSNEEKNIDYYLYLKKIDKFWMEYLTELDGFHRESEMVSARDIEIASYRGEFLLRIPQNSIHLFLLTKITVIFQKCVLDNLLMCLVYMRNQNFASNSYEYEAQG